jgi:general secretion pathway protein E
MKMWAAAAEHFDIAGDDVPMVDLHHDRRADARQKAAALAVGVQAVDRPTEYGDTQPLPVVFLDTLEGRTPSMEFVRVLSIAFARKHCLLGLIPMAARGRKGEEGGNGSKLTLDVVLADLLHLEQADVVRRIMRRRVQPYLATADQILAAINVAYEQLDGQTGQVIDSFGEGDSVGDVLQGDDLLEVEGRAPVIKLVNLLLFDAVKAGASDVHLQPRQGQVIARMRIDGVLFDAAKIPKDIQEEVVSRVKVLGGMDIAEKRLPQDGRASVRVGERLVDLRISSLPTSHGERIVLRLLDKSVRLYTLGELGMETETLAQFRKLIGLEHGLVLVTGPTGSGKSTTLYAALQELNLQECNVLTLEDPIEYQLEGISQTQVSDKKGLTFASGLRTVLRQDPDVIMVGEIRDKETAVMAIQSALTGHLVFSTLHTNDAASAVTRLMDLGIEPYLVASSVNGVLAQRLVRRTCDDCRCSVRRRDVAPGGVADETEGDWPQQLQIGRGCEACRGTGHRGRIGVFELLAVDEEVRAAIQSRANASEIRQVALRQGMPALREDGRLKVARGLTTVDEVLKVTARSDS